MVLIRILVFAYYAVFGWSSLRIGEFSIFDIMSLMVLPVILAARLGEGVTLQSLRLAQIILPTTLILFAVALSCFSATSQIDHLSRGLAIYLGLTITAINSSLIMSWSRVSRYLVIQAMSLSCLIHSLVVIIQGNFGLLRELSRIEVWQPWTRAVGLAEHPIEAGAISAYGICLQAYLMLNRPNRPVRAFAVPSICIMLYSLSVSASLTIFLGLGAALIIFIVLARQKILYIAGFVGICLGAAALSSSDLTSSQLGSRVSVLTQQGAEYGTVESRSGQISQALSKISASTILRGNGYNPTELPDGLEIHNSLIAALYHFGLLALLGQLLLIVIPTFNIARVRERHYAALVCSLTVIFLSCYLTGPSLARRSIWVPLLAIGLIPPIRRFDEEGRTVET